MKLRSWREAFRAEPIQWSSEYAYRALLRVAIRHLRRGLRVWWRIDQVIPNTQRAFPARVGRMILSVTLDDPVGRAIFYGRGLLRYERKTSAVLLRELKRGDAFLDAGSFCGWYTALAAQSVGRSGLVYAVEANPTRSRVLAEDVRRAGLRNVSVVGAALGAAPGRTTLHVPAAEAHQPQSTVGMHLDADADGLDVDVITVDSLALSRLDVVKLDIEGAEVDALMGARETLSRCRPRLLLIEAMDENLKGFGRTVDQLAGILNTLRYDHEPIAGGPEEASMWACRLTDRRAPG